MSNQRRHERFNLSLEIKVTWPGKDTILATAKNFSDGGVLLQVSFDEKPRLGTEMILQLNSEVLGDDAPRLLARVVRVNDEETAFQLITENQQV